MKSKCENSPSYKAIANVLKLILGEKNIAFLHAENVNSDYRIFSYCEDFEFLWSVGSFKGRGLASYPDVRNLILVCDGIPKQENNTSVDLKRYLTPLDWAVYLSLSFFDSGDISKLPKLKIFIIDLTPNDLAGSDSLRYFEQFPKKDSLSLEWMRYYRIAGSSKNNWVFSNLLLNIMKIENSSMRESFANDSKPDLDMVRRIWAASITKPAKKEDHHAIANLMGPQLLLSDMASNSDMLLNAFRNLMTSIKLLPNVTNTSSTMCLKRDNPWIDFEKEIWEERFKALGKDIHMIDFVIIDDMWHLGWGEFICTTVGIEYKIPDSVNEALNLIGNIKKINIYAAHNAEWLLKSLTGEQLTFGLQCENTKNKAQIIFLDLRLFAKGVLKDEAIFFKKLLPIAKKFKNNGHSQLPWPGFSDAEIRRVEEWVDGVKNNDSTKQAEDADYILALTFLPRILSLTDLSLPIILFSSTGRREITEHLKNYGNIITAFEKPRFSGSALEDILEQSRVKLEIAMAKALNLLKARTYCQQLIELGRKRQKEKQFEKKIHIEFFIDESGDNSTLKVGGCFAIFDDAECAISKAARFNDDLVDNGILYFEPLVKPVPKNRVKGKKDSCASELANTIGSENMNRPITIGALRLSCDSNWNREIQSDILNPESGDNQFRLQLSTLIELFLSESLPAIIGDRFKCDYNNVTISIFVATRLKKFDHAEEALVLKYKFGLSQTNFDEKKVYSLGKNEVWPIVSNILPLHNITNIQLCRVIGITLPYKGKAPEYPEYFVCNSCETVIHRKRGIKRILVNGSNDPGVSVGKVVKILNRACRICIDNERESLFSPENLWNCGFKPALGDIVKFTTGSETDRENKPVAKNLCKLADSEVKMVLLNNLACGCSKPDVTADYRALHYVADEILSHFPPQDKTYERSVKHADQIGAFDDVLNKDLDSVLRASRCLDRDEIVDAVKEIVDVFSNKTEASSGKKAYIMTAQRIGLALNRIKGSEFERLASLLSTLPA